MAWSYFGLVAHEAKGLLIGKTVDQTIVDPAWNTANIIIGIAHVNGVLTIQIGPEQMIATLSLEFAEDLRTPEIEA